MRFCNRSQRLIGSYGSELLRRGTSDGPTVPSRTAPGRRQDGVPAIGRYQRRGSRRLQGVAAIIHLAALGNDPLGDLQPRWTHEINHRASIQLALLARDAGVRRFLYASSCSIYGAAGRDDLLNEEAPVRPITAYATSKVRTEEALAMLADPSFSPVFMRNATAYGLSPACGPLG